MRILITGGAGFLGSHLSDRLLEMGHEVVVADNFYTGRKENVSHLLNNPRFELIRHDITFPLYIEVDGIFNLACPASPVQYQRNPVQTFKTNVHGTINMLGLAKRTGARFLQASTSEIYGDPSTETQIEEYWGNVNPIGIRSCYDEGKRAAESLTMDYRRQYSVDARVARIFNTFGPRMSQRDGRVVSNFVVQAITGEEITIYGDGSQTRSFCFVSDLVEGLTRLFFADRVEAPINLGNPSPISVFELARKVIGMVNSKSHLVFCPLPEDDPKQRKPDISRAEKLLSWAPVVPLDEGLKRTIEYFRETL